MTEADAWLPPDNYQEEGDEPQLARRTSPTNIGMSLLSTLAAHDLGYLSTETLVRRLDLTLTTLEGLERYQGHFLNWYDTATLAPLHPRYVSTVDSGNLAASLIALAQGLVRLTDRAADAARSGSMGSPTRPICWRARLPRAAATDAAARQAMTDVEPARARDSRRRAQRACPAVRRRGSKRLAASCSRPLARSTRLAPRRMPPPATSPSGARAVVGRRSPRVRTHARRCPTTSLQALARRASTLADAMRFDFLYDRRRRIFSIGYRLADADGPGRLDASFYDLLASEARLASFVAIAKGDVPQHHWFHLGRLVTNVNGRATLMSWGGTMFEYLMPLLLMRSFPGTLLDQSCRASVRRQIEYGDERGVPWGISESAYAFTDRAGNYQYRRSACPGSG